ncbi:poly-beta-1,6 N-acetyl-D-glucosamine synthase [Roseomonas alkaliterrae]|uniref:Poly-beta-1,6-N-acetyl-D-glucosamine synthase n=1 Tax=Neoroseomonas alkaliterrae TaxID=1452450 RepID=A0A840Y297_9PROT|nr:poly-beta-1,6-N-acetyl-D-glucosamine synthase [Neoroseomonas alkaliterrae]MBB5688004.1 biofilm PGA synthesis N-glycosyltransferase PgaC [Neoroseomonas alkaliterrae]MBR0677064.1 poly-beta-1,6 N-acetyl-D-glucosamine synthase [Neoroseomonas alkaliterrae]
MTEALALALPALYAFVGYWPLLMMLVWTIGGLVFYRLHEAGARQSGAPPDMPAGLRVSILIPCYNEEDNAAETIRACAAQSWPDFEIIAVNDGSRDRTAEVLDNLLAEIPRLRVVQLAQNQGKAMALRAGAMVASGEILVCIDGDAILHPDCVAWLVRRFANRPRLGAVTGNPRIRNRSSLLGLLQVGEFSATIGLIKRTQRLTGRVFTVSGVVVAFRLAALRDVGWWTDDNLTEDVDVTWKLQRRRWVVHFEPNALSYILMPETLRGLWKQRLRWSEGGAQTFLRYAPDFLNWHARRMWGVMAEYALSTLWCYALVLTLALTALGAFGLLAPGLAPSASLLSGWGMVLSVACLVQFCVALWIDRRHEVSNAQAFRPLLWVIWYPVAFWMLTAASAAVGFPRAVFRRSGRRARWTSPDRGFR